MKQVQLAALSGVVWQLRDSVMRYCKEADHGCRFKAPF